MTENDTIGWKFEVGEVISEDESFTPSFEGVGKVEGGSEYEVKRRLIDENSGEAFYFVEEETSTSIDTHLKSATMVHSLYTSRGMAEDE